jgi:hypothetical protein
MMNRRNELTARVEYKKYIFKHGIGMVDSIGGRIIRDGKTGGAGGFLNLKWHAGVVCLNWLFQECINVVLYLCGLFFELRKVCWRNVLCVFAFAC